MVFPSTAFLEFSLRFFQHGALYSAEERHVGACQCLPVLVGFLNESPCSVEVMCICRRNDAAKLMRPVPRSLLSPNSKGNRSVFLNVAQLGIHRVLFTIAAPC